MNSTLIFLDDERNLSDVTWMDYTVEFDTVLIARTPEQFKEYVISEFKTGNTFFISFDHDIASFNELENIVVETSGYDLLKWLCCYHQDNFLCDDNGSIKYNFPICSFHSQNVIGCNNMKMYYTNYLSHMFSSNKKVV